MKNGMQTVLCQMPTICTAEGDNALDQKARGLWISSFTCCSTHSIKFALASTTNSVVLWGRDGLMLWRLLKPVYFGRSILLNGRSIARDD